MRDYETPLPCDDHVWKHTNQIKTRRVTTASCRWEQKHQIGVAAAGNCCVQLNSFHFKAFLRPGWWLSLWAKPPAHPAGPEGTTSDNTRNNNHVLTASNRAGVTMLVDSGQYVLKVNQTWSLDPVARKSNECWSLFASLAPSIHWSLCWTSSIETSRPSQCSSWSTWRWLLASSCRAGSWLVALKSFYNVKFSR